jgi:2-polyprenyl-6-methoxyphenol hydroxylase-like FAD-dependent oxidoreductase
MWGYVPQPTPPEPQTSFVRKGSNILISAPTNNNKTMVAINPPHHELARAKADPLLYYTSKLNESELYNEQAEAAIRANIRIYQAPRTASFFREAVGPGWVLTGDAAMFKDPCTGQGMSDAFRHAEELASQIILGLGNGDIDKRLRRWWRGRDRDESYSFGFMTHQGIERNLTAFEERVLENLGRSLRGRQSLANVFSHRTTPIFAFSQPAAKALWSSFIQSQEGFRAAADLVGLGMNEAKWWSMLQASAIIKPRSQIGTLIAKG